MPEAIILGLAWLDRWCPTITWEDSYRKIKLGLGPLPPPDPAGEEKAKLQNGEKAAATAEALPDSPQGISGSSRGI